MTTLQLQAIERTLQRIQAARYCLDLARWADNRPAVRRHIDSIVAERKVEKALRNCSKMTGEWYDEQHNHQASR